MIEEAIVDAYTESEQAVGLHATIEQHLELPRSARDLRNRADATAEQRRHAAEQREVARAER
jgi:hypothetical protein